MAPEGSLIDLIRQAHRRTYERISFAVAALAIAIVALTASTDDAQASGGTSVGTAGHGGHSQGGQAGRLRLAVSRSAPGDAIIDSGRNAEYRFELAGSGTHDVVVRAIRVKGSKVVRHWKFNDVQADQARALRWNGRLNRKGWAPDGKYTFKVYKQGDHEQAADARKAKGKSRLNMHRNQFPIAAHHTYGDGFGAGRHHEGQDIMVACGKKIRAARGGRVQTRSYQSAAGNYVVIDGKGTGVDMAYMHMLRRGIVHAGERVHTGDVIGYVGQTGDATACHLHFELWSRPGWYEGGSPQPPTKALKKWDRYS